MRGPRERGLAHRAASLLGLRTDGAGADGAGAPPEELVDAFFDRELAPEDTKALFQALRGDTPASDEFNRTQDMLDELRRPVGAPDFTASVLAEVGRRRAWLPLPMRRFVTYGRFAAAACLLMIVGAGFVAQRVAPDAVSLAERPQPLTNLVQASRADAAAGIQNIASAIGSIRTCEPKPPCVARGGCEKSRPGEFERLFIAQRVERTSAVATVDGRATMHVQRVTFATRHDGVVSMMRPQPRFQFIEVSPIGQGHVLFGARVPDQRPLPEMFGDE